jgi:nucleoside-diphosphate-sugar epimerase
VPPIYIIGCGDIGQRVATHWQARGAAVHALARSAASAAALQARGITVLNGDLDQPESLPLPPAHSVVYFFAPPPSRGATDPRMRGFLDAIPGHRVPTRVVYISTSGVYGDVRGAWVTEESPLNPSVDRSRRRLDAEQALQTWAARTGVPVVILRVPGIYGPGRLPVDIVKSGRPFLSEAESLYTNRIHADDLANICVVAGEAHRPPGIYNVSDGNPGSMAQYFKAVADLLGVPRPPEVSMDEAMRVLSAEMMSYLTESRRVDNSKMLRELGVTLKYPTLTEGLLSCREKQRN